MPKMTPPSKQVALVYNADKPQAHQEWLRLKRWLEQRKVKVIASAKVTPAMKNADFVVAVGGDGTVLSVARQVSGWSVPVLGVNVGRLGFLAATEVGAMFRTLSRVLAGESRMEVRTMLSVTGVAKGRKFGPTLALNDCVVRSGSSGRVLQLQATVRNRPLASYAGDGLILATPTGSTAYNLAASGPILYPDLDVLLLCPICPHSLVQRPLVMPTFEVVEVDVLRPSPPALLCVDGLVTQTLHPGDRVVVRRADEQAKLLMDPDRTYYQVLQNKLKWGIVMLREIGIKNFVLIEDLRLELDKGLNVLTGETGAGKTIVLDALGLLLGDRFQSEQVRQGAEKSSIDGTFDVPKHREFQAWWKDHDFEKPDDILIRREGYPDGRSKAYLNDQPVTLTTLQDLGAFLVDVHGQNEHQQIMKPSVQLALLDRFAGLQEKREAIEPLFKAWKDLREQQSAKALSEEERLQRVDVYRFQLQEIEKAHLTLGEEENLTARLPELKNAERLQSLANTAYGTLYQDEGSALERLGQVEKAFESLRSLAPSVDPLSKELEDAKVRLEDVAHGLQALAARWEADPAALEESLNRLDLLSRLKKIWGNG